MLSDFELNIYKALDELVGSEKKFKILETEDILNTTKKFDTTADIAKIPDVIKDFKDKDLIDLRQDIPSKNFCGYNLNKKHISPITRIGGIL